VHVDLLEWTSEHVYTVKLLVLPAHLTRIVGRAIRSRDGRATTGDGAFVILVKRKPKGASAGRGS
jgi:hypothetical protein